MIKSMVNTLAFRFMGCTTDEARRIIVNALGDDCWKHAEFAHQLTLIGHPHDWQCYKEIMCST